MSISPAPIAVSRWGINVPIIYTKAYACYALKCVVAPDIPNNWASLEPFTHLLARQHPERRAPGAGQPAARDRPYGARSGAGRAWPRRCPGKILAEGAAALWNIHMSVRPDRGADGRRAEILMFNSGGMGARPGLDGLSATAFPSGVMTMPIEATEQTGPDRGLAQGAAARLAAATASIAAGWAR